MILKTLLKITILEKHVWGLHMEAFNFNIQEHASKIVTLLHNL